MHNKSGSQRLLGEVQMFRIRVATAESKLNVLREQSRQAKRRRKEAKRIAQRARKALKLFKADLAELKQALAKAETKLFEAGGRALARRMAKRTRAAKTSVSDAKKAKAPARRPVAHSPATPRSTKRVARKPAAAKRSVSKSRAVAATINSKPSTPQPSDTNTRTYEQENRDQGQQKVEDQSV